MNNVKSDKRKSKKKKFIWAPDDITIVMPKKVSTGKKDHKKPHPSDRSI